MPQLSLYIDDGTLKRLEICAKINNTSVSRFVSVTLKRHLDRSWPDGYRNLFGSIKDDSFLEQPELDACLDAAREEL